MKCEIWNKKKNEWNFMKDRITHIGHEKENTTILDTLGEETWFDIFNFSNSP